jgi:hypothetical protein
MLNLEDTRLDKSIKTLNIWTFNKHSFSSRCTFTVRTTMENAVEKEIPGVAVVARKTVKKKAKTTIMEMTPAADTLEGAVNRREEEDKIVKKKKKKKKVYDQNDEKDLNNR